MRRLLPWTPLLLMAACPDFGGVQIPCAADDNCPTGNVCTAGFCAPGASAPDGGLADAGLDAGNDGGLRGNGPDGGNGDAGDGGAADTEDGGDGGAPRGDAGTDGGLADGGQSDGGRADAGPAPTIASLFPSSALVGAAATSLTITGTGFTATSTVTLDSVALQLSSESPTQLTTSIPASSLLVARDATLTVTNPASGEQASATFAVDDPAPSLTLLTPQSVLLGAPDTALAATGAGFVNGSVLQWNGNALVTDFIDAGLLTATIPAADLVTPASIPVTVVSPGPGGGSSAPLTFTVTAAPTAQITSISPSSVPLDSAAVSISVLGSYFAGDSVVLIDDAGLSTTFQDGGLLLAAAPASALTIAHEAQVTVLDPGTGNTSNAVFLAVDNPAPTLSAISPTSAVQGAASVTLTLHGSSFATGATVSFGGATVAPSTVSATSITAQVPSSSLVAAGSYAVAVVNPGPGGGTSASRPFLIDPIIQTIAGGDYGDSEPALEANLMSLTKPAVSPSGETYYGEQGRNRVMKIDAAGNLVKVAGFEGVCGQSGNGGPALAAELCTPSEAVFDDGGDLFFIDVNGAELREVTPTGTISDVAGIGVCGEAADGANAATSQLGAMNGLALAPNGDLYVSVCGCGGNEVRKISGGILTTVAGNSTASSTGDGAAATSATLDCPAGLSFDSTGSRLYVAEFNGARVRMIDLGSGLISTVAGKGSLGVSGLNGPATQASLGHIQDVIVDAAGDLYLALYDAPLIVRVDATTQDVSAFAGQTSYTVGPLSGDEGPATSAYIGRLSDLFFDANGNVAFANSRSTDSGDAIRLREVDDAGVIHTLAGDWSPSDAGPLSLPLNGVRGVTADLSGDVFVTTSLDDVVWMLSPSGDISRIAGDWVPAFSGDNGPALSASFNVAQFAWVDPTGIVYVADINNGRVRAIDTFGNITTVAGRNVWPTGCPAGSPTSPPAGTDGGYDCYGDGYLAIDAILGSTAGTRPTADNGFGGIVGDGDGNLYIAEGDRIRRVDVGTGLISTIAGSTATSSSCGFSGDDGPATAALLCQPEGLAIDPAGDLVFADEVNHRIRKINLQSAPVGVITTIGGSSISGAPGDGVPFVSSNFVSPTGVAYDSYGQLYISDFGVPSVSTVDLQGTIHRIAGTGTAGFSGDGASALSSPLDGPEQITVVPDVLQAGWFFLDVADSKNDRVRQIGPFGAPL